MRYSLLAEGKRLRPILCLASAESVGGSAKDVMTAACSLEMIHAYSLIHDDLPAMDNDTLRRGRPTCHIAFDEATAVLAGDALLTLAFELLATAGLHNKKSSDKWLLALQIIANGAGHHGMIEGQMRDIASEGIRISAEELESIHTLKTGALITASVRAGAILGGGTTEEQERLAEYGRNIGLAFQVTDDILNVEGDPVVMGKAVGTDSENNKNTYPATMGIEKSKTLARQLVDNALHSLDNFDRRSDPLRAIALYIFERKR